jgi:hypothetical protein
MSQLPPTGPSPDSEPSAPEKGDPVASRSARAGREFDTKDTQEIPVSGLPSLAPRTMGGDDDPGAPDAGTAAESFLATGAEPPADADGLRSVVLARVRETREELLRLIDRFLEQQDQRARAAEADRLRAEEEQQKEREREEAERVERERVAAAATADLGAQLERTRERLVELESVLALREGMPEQVAALQTDVVQATREIERLQALAEERREAADKAERLPAVESRLAAADRRVARSGAVLASLRRALLRLDEAGSQTEVLARLLEEATGFASRSALFLVRRPQPLGDLRLAAWGACGFSDQAAERIEVMAPAAWRGAIEGRTLRGGAELGAPVALASESETPIDALIVPFILRDETRALLYVDRFDADHPFEIDALQLLCFVAAHALEVLPLRHKRPAGTLQDPDWAGATEAEAPSAATANLSGVDAATTSPTEIPLAAVAAVVADRGTAETEAPESMATATAEPVDQEEASVPEPPFSPAAPPPPPALWEAPATAFEATPEPVAAAEPELAALETVDLGDAVGPLPSPVEVTTQEVDVRALGIDLDVEPPQVRTEEPEVEAAQEVAPAREEEPEPPPGVPGFEGGAAPAEPEDAIPARPRAASSAGLFTQSLFGAADAGSEADTADAVGPGRAALDSLLSSPVAVPPPPPVDLWRTPPSLAPAAPPPIPAQAPAPPPPTAAAPPPEPPAAETRPASPSVGREVVPPSDIQGPGWAFAGGRRAGSDEEHAHEEAKRLARLLVSELQLYNEEEIDEGRRQGNVYRFLKEHIDKSRMLYEERVDEKIRQSTDYFREELVKSLAGGDPARLGF